MGNLAAKSSLSTKQLAILESEMNRRKRSAGLAYALCFFIFIGAHQFYLKNKFKAGLYIACMGFPFLSFIMTMGTALSGSHDSVKAAGHTLGGMWAFSVLLLFVGGLSLLYDLFTLSGQTDRANEKIEAEVMSEITGKKILTADEKAVEGV